MSAERTSSGPAADKSPAVYRMEAGAIPKHVHQHVGTKLGESAEVYPAKEGGSYKGPVIYADSDLLVQAVGKNQKTAVVHLRPDVEMVGASLKARDANNDLVNRNVQIHYKADQAKAYPWDVEREQAQRASRQQDKPAQDRPALDASTLQQKAAEYAATNIKNVKQREAFLKHLDAVAQVVTQPQQAKTADKTAADRGIER